MHRQLSELNCIIFIKHFYLSETDRTALEDHSIQDTLRKQLRQLLSRDLARKYLFTDGTWGSQAGYKIYVRRSQGPFSDLK